MGHSGTITVALKNLKDEKGKRLLTNDFFVYKQSLPGDRFYFPLFFLLNIKHFVFEIPGLSF